VRQPSRIARRYAAALFHAASRQNLADAVAQDLEALSRFLADYPQVLEALAVPRVPAERKKAAIQDLVGRNLSQDLTRRFLDLMIDHGRETYLPQAADAYALLLDEARNIVAADVRTAAPLDDDRVARLKTKLDRMSGHDTRLNITTDPTLVGGLIVRIGDTILDGSVRGYLEQFETQLRNAPLAAIRLEDIPMA
jgi:F-type H+-transporting ATPase subunit delta